LILRTVKSNGAQSIFESEVNFVHPKTKKSRWLSHGSGNHHNIVKCAISSPAEINI
jgi:hypothetical protein